MSFNYNSYAKDLNELLQSPGTWLAKQKIILKELNLDIIKHNLLYLELNSAQREKCDSEYPNCRGELKELKSMTDADLLLFAIFGPMHILNPTEKIRKLKECIKRKMECLLREYNKGDKDSGSTPVPTPTLLNNILIVMIGNMPTEKESREHFKKFIEQADETLHVVVHPMKVDITQDIINNWQSIFKNKNNLMICDLNHWVKTAWGNISLSLATLMAMEYAMKNKPYNYYKKIVFIQQCMPLYNYNIIKNEFIKDNRSWFKPRNGEYPQWQYSYPYNFNRDTDDGATIYDWNWWRICM
jgi:hypothetical protein